LGNFGQDIYYLGYTILHVQDIQPIDGFSVIRKCMTLNDPE